VPVEALRLEMDETERQQAAATRDGKVSLEAGRQQILARLVADPRVLTEVRGLLTRLLAAATVPAPRRHDALLVADEVAANAIAHGSRPGDEIEICCRLKGDCLNIVVFDCARNASAPVALTPDEERTAGRGLQVVDRLADSWTETIVNGRRKVTVEMIL
jgi:anti-sigma regulatory factor (Ser/Thr protein kinase)